jgi:hypothetical protein
MGEHRIGEEQGSAAPTALGETPTFPSHPSAHALAKVCRAYGAGEAIHLLRCPSPYGLG